MEEEEVSDSNRVPSSLSLPTVVKNSLTGLIIPDEDIVVATYGSIGVIHVGAILIISPNDDVTDGGNVILFVIRFVMVVVLVMVAIIVLLL